MLILYYYFGSISFWTIQSQLSPLWIEASEAVYSRHDCCNERETESWGGERRKGVLRINLSRWNKKTQMAWLAEWMGAQTTDHQWSLNRRKPKCFGPNGHTLLCRTFHCWKIHLILVIGKVVSKTQYLPLCNCKVMSIGFYSPFYMFFFALHSFDIFLQVLQGFISTMWILWCRKCYYWVFHITYAGKGLPNHSSSTRD